MNCKPRLIFAAAKRPHLAGAGGLPRFPSSPSPQPSSITGASDWVDSARLLHVWLAIASLPWLSKEFNWLDLKVPDNEKYFFSNWSRNIKWSNGEVCCLHSSVKLAHLMLFFFLSFTKHVNSYSSSNTLVNKCIRISFLCRPSLPSVLPQNTEHL